MKYVCANNLVIFSWVFLRHTNIQIILEIFFEIFKAHNHLVNMTYFSLYLTSLKKINIWLVYKLNSKHNKNMFQETP